MNRFRTLGYYQLQRPHSGDSRLLNVVLLGPVAR